MYTVPEEPAEREEYFCQHLALSGERKRSPPNTEVKSISLNTKVMVGVSSSTFNFSNFQWPEDSIITWVCILTPDHPEFIFSYNSQNRYKYSFYAFTFRSGRLKRNSLSKRPGLLSAGSIESSLFVAPMTTISPLLSNPSMRARSVDTIELQ